MLRVPESLDIFHDCTFIAFNRFHYYSQIQKKRHKIENK